MKNTVSFFSLGILSIVLFSCAPVYRCGDDRPISGIHGTNRLIAVVNERDSLCDMITYSEQENTILREKYHALSIFYDSVLRLTDDFETKYGALQSQFNTLDKKHDSLKSAYLELSERYATAVSEKLNLGHLYDERLKEKERRMDLKEQELKDKQALLTQQTERLTQQEKELAEREKEIADLQREIAQKDSITNHMNNLIKNALLGFDSDELTTEIRDGKVYVSMSDKLMFQSGQATVQQKGKEALGALANVLKKNQDFQIAVEGHTDSIPIKTSKYKDNWDLSVARATEIVRILQVNHGLNPLRLTASGRGEYFPRASNSTADGRAKNRRTEIILTPDLRGLMEMLDGK